LKFSHIDYLEIDIRNIFYFRVGSLSIRLPVIKRMF